MTPTDRDAIRSWLDGARQAIEYAIEDAVDDLADAPPICEQLRDLITAERALADDVPQAEFDELVRRVREGRGR